MPSDQTLGTPNTVLEPTEGLPTLEELQTALSDYAILYDLPDLGPCVRRGDELKVMMDRLSDAGMLLRIQLTGDSMNTFCSNTDILNLAGEQETQENGRVKSVSFLATSTGNPRLARPYNLFIRTIPVISPSQNNDKLPYLRLVFIPQFKLNDLTYGRLHPRDVEFIDIVPFPSAYKQVQ